MSRVVVLGRSAAGLLTAIVLARRGLEVTVLERDRVESVAPAVEEQASMRAGAPHAVQGHGFLARASVELRRSAPDVYEALVSAGAGELRLAEWMPSAITDRAPRPGDDELVMLSCRRHTFDRVLFEVAAATPGVDLRYRVAASGIELAAAGSARVKAVRLQAGERLAAEWVVDASGRRTLVPRWLAAQGIDLPLEAWDCGIVYFTRHYRVHDGVELPPLNRGNSAGALLPSLTAAWFLGDNDTAMLGLTPLAEDRLLKSVRHPDRFELVARSVPSIAAWLECSEPITGVFGMGALKNTLRRLVRDGAPLVLGLHLIGDACCTTNPTLGRGLSFATAQVRRLAEVADKQVDDPAAAAVQMDDFLTREIEPRFRENAEYDRARVAALRGDLAGAPPAALPPPLADTVTAGELALAALQDADLFRIRMRTNNLLDGIPVLSDPHVVQRVRSLVPAGAQPPPPDGPNRAQLLDMLTR